MIKSDLSMNTIVRHDGTNVMLIENGKLVAVWPWEVADMMAKAITSQARKAEEIAKAEKIIYDNAILHRSGAPFGLSNHPKILDETKKETAWNGELRRYMPKIKSTELIHCPAVRIVNNAKPD